MIYRDRQKKRGTRPAKRNRAVRKFDADKPIELVHVYITSSDTGIERVDYAFKQGNKNPKYDLLIESIAVAMRESNNKFNPIFDLNVQEGCAHTHNRRFDFVAKRIDGKTAYKIEATDNKTLNSNDLAALFALAKKFREKQNEQDEKDLASHDPHEISLLVSIGRGQSNLAGMGTVDGVTARIQKHMDLELLADGLASLTSTIPAPRIRLPEIMMDEKFYELKSFTTYKRFSIIIRLDSETGVLDVKPSKNFNYDDERYSAAIFALSKYFNS